MTKRNCVSGSREQVSDLINEADIYNSNHNKHIHRPKHVQEILFWDPIF